MKPCICCKIEKPLTDFYKHKKMKDGHLNKCIECVKNSQKQNRKINFATIQEYEKKRANLPHRVLARENYAKTEKGKSAIAKAHNTYKEKHPLRRYAHVVLNNALRDGRINKHLCFICGDESEAHHPDYSRPLDVMWLCNTHHREAHSLTKGEVK